ncbi:DUF998 domain-containing protein [Nonomuraea cavernae]|uniref:DUF998 domain-containing protein n=1 Tax=Nonomuraea cavernae TaxID=2045107 RepID=A0A917YVC3_9ACTN|nr:DUF998 domain-containing protein [Nonomuraea cavernae]MCA2185215.1 DUF998 domain-containing protein [Nonomuraea cavernae]GGO65761.1 hypothetical protein GCM10012289_18210 [Nonomuraea cavernae]
MKALLVSGLTATGAGTGAMLILHARAGLDPMHTVISEYAFHSDGWLLPTALTLFAAGGVLTAEALRRAGAGRWIVMLLVAWAVSMFLIGAFPTDRPGVPLSMSGGIHRYAAFAAFLVMPAAGMLLARDQARYARTVRVLSAVALGALLLVVVPYVLRMFGIPLTNDDIPAGLTQRVVVITELGVLALAGLSLLRPSLQRSQGGASPILA